MFTKTFFRSPWTTKTNYFLLSLCFFIVYFLGKIEAIDDKDENTYIQVSSTPYSLEFSLDESYDNYVLENITCKSIKNVEVIANDAHICENLDPCSSYLVMLVIRVLSSENPYTFEQTLDAKTNYTEPVVNINEVTPSIDYINISWTAIDGTCVSKYIIEVKSIEKELHYETYDKRELQVKELNPCLNHSITLKVIDVNELLLTNLTSSTKTEYAEPGDVNISFTDDSNGHKKVSWESPVYKSCIDYYSLRWFLKNCTSAKKELLNEENECEWYDKITDSNAMEYILKDLQGCEEYGFSMFINNNSTAKAKNEFTSPEQVPDAVVGQTLDIGNTTIDIYWQPPKNHKKCVKSYIVTITGPMQSEIIKEEENRTNETSIFFKNLNPCGYYNLSIVAEAINTSFGSTWTSSFVLNEDKPTEVQNTKVVAKSYELEIFWDAPAIANLCVKEYRLSGWTEKGIPVPEFDETTSNTTVKFKGLNSCQAYIVQIIPTTLSGNIDGDLQQIETLTAAVVAQAPNNFQVVGLYPNRLELSAQELDSGNKCETISSRFVCEALNSLEVLHKTAEQYVNDGQVGGISFQALLSPLSPYIEYRCQVSLFNIAGWSTTKSLIQRTEPYFPDRPEQIKLDTSTNTSLNFVWQRPKYANGNINVYKTYLQMYEPNYFVPPSCTAAQSKSELRETSKAEQSFLDLQPYTKYSIQVAAQNEYGIGEYTRPFIVTTKPWVSDPVNNLEPKTEGPYNSKTEYGARVEVSWQVPCKSNGIIEKFHLEFIGNRTNYPGHIISHILIPKLDDNGTMRFNETGIKPEHNYIVNVMIKTKEVEQLSVGMHAMFEAPAGIPQTPHESILNQTKVNAYDSNNPTKTAVVRFPKEILESESGTIVYMALLLSEKNCNPYPNLRYGAINALLEWPDSLTWYNAYEKSTTNCIHQYQTTPLHWKPSVALTRKKNLGLRFTPKENEIVYIIGTDVCSDRETQYCNGPLRPDTEYNLVFRLFTKSGYSDLCVLEFKTDSLIQVTLILISVCSSLLFAFTTGLIYLWITKRIQWNRQSCNSIGDSFGDIIPKNFATYYRDIAKHEKIVREFKELSGVAMDLSCSASEVGSNKNRYTDIYPYDKNRVILDIDVDGSDYINASFIDGYNRKKEYIATQGPKAESTLDFWRMVLQYNVRVIVMLTQLREGDVIKCHQYFPFQSNGIYITIKKKESFDLYDRTEINAVHDKYGLKQKVVHYYFKKWPDHDCPTDANQLTTFVKKVKSEKIPRYSPIVVHCSAGVGRTGTFIGLDIIIQRLKSEYKINIFETVKKLRFQRMKMVQTLAQYTFLYTCTYELVKHKKSKQPSNYKNKGGKTVSFQDEHDIKVDHRCENDNSSKVIDLNGTTFLGRDTYRNSQNVEMFDDAEISS